MGDNLAHTSSSTRRRLLLCSVRSSPLLICRCCLSCWFSNFSSSTSLRQTRSVTARALEHEPALLLQSLCLRVLLLEAVIKRAILYVLLPEVPEQVRHHVHLELERRCEREDSLEPSCTNPESVANGIERGGRRCEPLRHGRLQLKLMRSE